MVKSTCNKCGPVQQVANAAGQPSCGKCGTALAPPPTATVMGFPQPPSPGPANSANFTGGPALASFDAPGEIEALELGEPLPAAASPTSDVLAGIPSPKRRSPLSAATDAFADLPAPKAALDIVDLPAPKATDAFADLPAPKATDVFADLPAPKAALDIVDLPAPKATDAFADLPAPKAALDIVDLPAPKATDAFADLPAPKAALDIVDLPAPKATDAFADLPAPKGFQESSGRSEPPALDLPAPKGFFDDVPAPDPGATQSGRAGTDLPAPKGFFDDVPAPISGAAQSGRAGTDLPAPKGFFDDVPAPVSSQPRGAAASKELDLPAPAGFFEDLPAPKSTGPATLDLDDLELAPPSADRKSAPVPLELDSAPASGERFGEVDLPAPTGAGVSFTSNSTPLPDQLGAGGAGDELSLQTDNDALTLDRGEPTAAEQRKAATVAAQEKAAAQSKKQSKRKAAENKRPKTRRRNAIIALGTVTVLGAAGVGGYMFYQDRQSQDRKSKQVASLIKRARAQLASDKPQHWDRAAKLGKNALRISKDHTQALGIVAQAYYAGLLDEGTQEQSRRNSGLRVINKLDKLSADGADVDKAQGLGELVNGKPESAVEFLTGVIKKNPRDGDAYLYLGWAYAAKYDFAAAIKAFTSALKSNQRRIAALYGLGKAEAELGNEKAAREAFQTILQITRDDADLGDHIGALVGNAQLVRGESFTARENRLREILSRDDVEKLLSEKDPNKYKIDPRAVSLAFSLAGAHALRAGRIDESKQRFDTAERLNPTNHAAKVGLAKAALKQFRLEGARKKLLQVLSDVPEHFDARLTLAEVATAENRLSEAQSHIDKLTNTAKTLDNKADLVRYHMVRGKIHEATQTTRQQAVAEYEKARSLAGKDIRPTIALSSVLGVMGEHKRALDLLAPVHKRAESDPALAVTLGLAYRSAGQPQTAQKWFEVALERKPTDIEARFQRGLVLHDQNKTEAAINDIQRAYDSDQARDDIGLRLAVIYESLDRNAEAGKLYDLLLKGRTPTINVRARAGRFLARNGDIKRAAKLGGGILQENPQHAAGFYLLGEGLLDAGRMREAERNFKRAVEIDPAPQYLDALGRAYERAGQGKHDEAVRAYARAAKANSKYLSPRMGIARIWMNRGNCGLAVPALQEAQKLNPTNEWIYFSIGQCYRRLNKVDEAISSYKTAIKYAPKNAEAHFTLGTIYFQAGKSGEAARSLTKAAQYGQKLVEDGKPVEWLTKAYRQLGFAERARRNKRAAIQAWEHYLARNPKDVAAARDVRNLLFRLKGN